MPNCQKCGLFAGQGLTHGRFATAMKGLPMVRAVVGRCCAAFGMGDPWGPVPAYGGPPTSQTLPCHSFDALGLTTTAHKYQAMEEHVDSNAIEPGLLQHFIFVHPPPDASEVRLLPAPGGDHPASHMTNCDYLRLGVLCAWYNHFSKCPYINGTSNAYITAYLEKHYADLTLF